jgi:hypothetical protein
MGSETTFLNVTGGWMHAAVLAAASTVIAVAAVQFADYEGEPKFLFERTNGCHPTIVVRRAFIERAAVKVPEGRAVSYVLRFLLAAVLSFVFLRQLAGWWSLALIACYLVGVWVARFVARDVGIRSVHPAVKAVPMFLVSKVIGTYSVHVGHAVVPLFVVAVVLVASMFVRTRTLWRA